MSTYYESDIEETLQDELFLSEMPLSLIKHSIEQQFEAPLDDRRRDHFETFIEKYSFSKENMYEDEIYELELMKDDFLRFMVNLFDEHLGIGIVDLDQMPEEDQFNILQIPYRFFIKYMKKNFANLIINYVEAHKEELVRELPMRKDVTTNRLLEEIGEEGEADITILSNLDEVIEKVMNVELDVDAFFKLCTPNEPFMELEYVKIQFNEFKLTGNFVEPYKEKINGEFLTELESKVRNKILKKYSKKIITKEDLVAKNDENEPSNNEEE